MPGLVKMSITVPTDRVALGFPLPDVLPEVFARRSHLKVRIPIIGHDGEHGFNPVLVEKRLNSLPDRPIHLWGDIVESQEESTF